MPRRSSQKGMIMIVCPCCKTVFSLYDLSSRSPERYLGFPIPRRAVSQYDVRIDEEGVFRCPVCNARLSLRKLKVLIYKYKEFIEKMGEVITLEDGRRIISIKTSTDFILMKALTEEIRRRIERIANEAMSEMAVNTTSSALAGEDATADLAD